MSATGSVSGKIRVSCFNCGTTNYYPLDAEGKKVVCGRCKNALPIPGTVLELPPGKAFPLFRKSSLPVLIDFYSPSCAPCYAMHPFVERLAMRRKGELMVVKINVDNHPEIASGFGVQAVPTFIIVHKGYERARSTGYMSEENFSLWVASNS